MDRSRLEGAVIARSAGLLAAPAVLGAALVLGAYIQTAGHPSEMFRPLAVTVIAALAVTLLAWAVSRKLIVATWIGLVTVGWLLGREFAALPLGIGLAVLTLHQVRRVRGVAAMSVPTAFVLMPPLALCGVATYQLIAGGVIAPDDFSLDRPAPSAAVVDGDLPSIYVLLLDGYPRADELQAAFGYDNSAFTEDLGRLGFRVYPEATATFGGTSWTLASTMLEDAAELHRYADIDSTADLWDTLRDLRREYLVNVPMMDRLREARYRLEYVAAGVDLSEWRGWDATHDSGNLTDTEAMLIQRSPVAGPMGGWVMDQLRSRVETSLRTWAETSKDQRQKISFAHIMSPHLPFLWGPNDDELQPGDCWFARACSLHTVIAAALGLSLHDYGDLLGWQLEAINRRTLDSVRTIVEADSEAVVVIMSDHGARFKPRSQERFHTFLATRIPHDPDLLASDPGPDALFARLLASLDP